MAQGHVRDLLNASVEWKSSGQKLVALLMAYHADRRGIIRLTQVELSESALLSVGHINRVIDDLCNLDVITRIGHGRYGIRFGISQDEPTLIPQPRGQAAEERRLQAIVDQEKADGVRVHSIAYGEDCMPVLVPYRRGYE